MDNTNLIIGLGGALLLWYVYVDSKKNRNSSILNKVKNVTNDTIIPLKKEGGNPENEKQPVISTNNAQQPPKLVEDNRGVL